MPCVAVPIPVLPVLPAPFSLTPPALPVIGTPGICCNLIPPIAIIPPITLPSAVLNPAVILTINAAMQTVQTYLDNLIPGCPRSA